MKTNVPFLALLSVFFLGGMPIAYSDSIAYACSFEIYEDGIKFSGDELHENGIDRDYGTCKKDSACIFWHYCPDSAKFYKFNESEVFVGFAKNGEEIAQRNKQRREEKSEYSTQVNIPPPPADMKGYSIGSNIDCDGHRFVGGVSHGFERKIQVDIKTGKVADTTDYENLHQVRKINEEKRIAKCEKQMLERKRQNQEDFMLLGFVAASGLTIIYLIIRIIKDRKK